MGHRPRRGVPGIEAETAGATARHRSHSACHGFAGVSVAKLPGRLLNHANYGGASVRTKAVTVAQRRGIIRL